MHVQAESHCPLTPENTFVTLDTSQFLISPYFVNQPLNDWDVSNDDWDVSNVSHVTTMDDMFLGATSFNQPRHAPWYH